MNVLVSMPASGIIVIAAIAILFVLAVLLLFYTFSNRMYCFSGRRRNALCSIFTVSGCRKIKNHANTLLNGTSSGCFSATARKNSAPSPEDDPVIIAIFIHALLLYPSCFGHL